MSDSLTRDDTLLDHIIESFYRIEDHNRKDMTEINRRAMRTVENKNCKKYKLALELLEKNMSIQIESTFRRKKNPVYRFDEWIEGQPDLVRFIKSPMDDYCHSEQIYYSKRLIEEYTEYADECRTQLIFPSPFPNVPIMNRTCEFIVLRNGVRIDNPHYQPDPDTTCCWF